MYRGFRTGKKWKKIVSLVGHALILLLIVSSFSGITAGDKFINGARMMFFMIIPYVLLTNVGNIRRRIPFFKKKGRTIGKVIIGTVVWSLMFLLSFMVIFAATESFLSPQQKALEFVKNQQREIESRLKKEAKEREELKSWPKRSRSGKQRKRPSYRRKLRWRLPILRVMKQSLREN
jgi:hypothetical protein